MMMLKMEKLAGKNSLRASGVQRMFGMDTTEEMEKCKGGIMLSQIGNTRRKKG